MPFRSAKQRRYMYARHPAIAKRWARHGARRKTKTRKAKR